MKNLMAYFSWNIGVILCLATAVFATPWYSGCYVRPDSFSRLPSGGDTVAQCCGSCNQQGFSYCGQGQVGECYCGDDLPANQSDTCRAGCVPSTPLLPCGSADSSLALYTSLGPYLNDVTITVPDYMTSSAWVGVQASGHFAQDVLNATTGIAEIDSDPSLLSHVTVTWRVVPESAARWRQAHAQTVEASGRLVQNVAEVEFVQEGEFVMEVTVSHALGSLTNQKTVTVHSPAPYRLEASLATPPADLPPCIPQQYWPWSEEKVTVYQNQQVELEASLTAGRNVTFTWRFDDVTDGDVTPGPGDVTEDRHAAEGECQGIHCLMSVVSHQFTTEGLHTVTVTATNQYGSLQRTLTVVVSSKSIHTLSLRPDPASLRHVIVRQPTTFILTINTPAKIFSPLNINFQDGNVVNYALNHRETAAQEQNGDLIHLIVDHETNCQIVFEIQHTYTKTGSFRAGVTISEGNGQETGASIEHPLIVQELVRGVSIHAPSAVKIGSQTKFEILYPNYMSNLSAMWTITNSQNDEILTKKGMEISHEFHVLGNYELEANVSNFVSYETVKHSVVVQAEVVNLTLELSKTGTLTTFEPIEIRCRIKSGTAVDFEWSYPRENLHGKAQFSENLSVLKLTFSRAGEYEVRVKARNLVTVREERISLKVEEPVQSMVLQSHGPVLLGEISKITVAVDGGSNVRFEADFGSGRDAVVVNHNGMYLIQREFQVAGVHLTRIYALNDVSEMEESVDLIVERDIGGVSIVAPAEIVRGNMAVLIANIDGEVSSRSDVVYYWSADGSNYTTRTPQVGVTFSRLGNTTVHLQASNLVTSQSATLPVRVVAVPSQPLLEVDPFTEFGLGTNITIRNLPANCDVKMDFGHGNADTITGVTASVQRFQHVYHSAGYFNIVATVRSDGAMTSLQTRISVQERVTGLQVSGPRHVPLYRLSRHSRWLGEAGSGTDTVRTWSIDGTPVHTSSRDYFYHKFDHPGTYRLTLRAFNAVNHALAHYDVIVQRPITDLAVTVAPVVMGTETSVVMVIRGSRTAEIAVDFGDSTVTMATEETQNGQNGGLADGATNTEDSQVSYRLTLRHRYAAAGTYNVTVNVSNVLSEVIRHAEAYVEMPIGPVTLTLEPAGDVIEADVTLVAMATVEHGESLQYEWDFGDDGGGLVVENSGRSSRARYTYTYPDVYYITVRVYNDIQEVTSPARTVNVVYRIETVIINEVSGKRAAALDLYNDEEATDKVIFQVSCLSGTEVTFDLDLGDGTTLTARGQRSLVTRGLEARFTHKYTAVGAYNVSVRATNPLGSVTRNYGLFYVQEPPERIGLDRMDYVGLPGKEVEFTVFSGGGTNISYEWNFGDHSSLPKAGSFVKHVYIQSGRYVVNVTAYNLVGRSNSEAKYVHIRRHIMGVELSLEKTLGRTGEPIALTALANPSSEDAVGWYEWAIGDAVVKNKEAVYRHIFTRRGTYAIRVKAASRVDSKTSSPREIRIIEPLSEVTLLASSDPILGEDVSFTAQHFQGSDVTYVWDMGDGTNVTSRKSSFTHKFNSEGAYRVLVVAENELGQRMVVDKLVFVLKQHCHTPEIDILGTKFGQTTVTFERSSPVRIEADVIINCTTGVSTDFTWTILKTHQNGSQQLVSLEEESLKERTLIVKERSLEYGNYTAKLTARMRSSIVYGTAEIGLQIVPTKLISVISGGLVRNVSRYDVITLDGRRSRDPDFPDNRLSYAWSCHVLGHPEQACWLAGEPGLNQSLLQIHGSRFHTAGEYLVNLTVWAEARGLEWTTQVLVVSERSEMISVRINCPLCGQRVNANYRLVMEAQCDQCSYSDVTDDVTDEQDDVTYSWELYIVADGNEFTPAGAHDLGSCVEADGSSYIKYLRSLNTTTPAPTTTSLPPTTTTPYTAPTTTPSGTQAPTTKDPVDPGDIFGGISEGNGGGGGRTKRQAPREAARGQAVPNSGFGGSGGFLGFDFEEAQPGEAGSAGGRGTDAEFGEGPSEGRPGGGRPGEATGGTDTGGSDTGTGGDMVKDGLEDSRDQTHIVTKARYKIIFRAENTLTGLNKRSLVVRPGFLRQGRTYMAQVTVTRGRGARHRSGTALVAFSVNESPVFGQCTIRPKQGREMDTWFKVFCKEWQEKNIPIHYEVSYRLDDVSSRDVIYRGMNPEVVFALPAGKLPDRNVLVDVSILDNLGARTSVCSIPVLVETRPASENYTIEDELYAKVVGADSELRRYVQKGDHSNVRLLVRLVAHRLATLPRLAPPNPLLLKRKHILHALLLALDDVRVSDENEALQAASALKLCSDLEEELDEDSLAKAAQVQSKILNAAAEITSQSGLTSQSEDQWRSHLLTVIVQSSSNIVAALHKAEERFFNKDYVDSAIPESIEGLNGLFKGSLRFHTSDEPPVQRSTDQIQVKAKLFQLGSKGYSIAYDKAKFLLPASVGKNIKRKRVRRSLETEFLKGEEDLRWETRSLEAIKENVKRVKRQIGNEVAYSQLGTGDDFGAVMMQIPVNLYSRGGEVDSSILSLDVYTREGEAVDVSGLEGTLVEITIPRNAEPPPPSAVHTLYKSQLAHFPLSPLGSSGPSSLLQLSLLFSPVPPGLVSFPVAIMVWLDADSTPSLTNYDYKEVFPAEQRKIDVAFPYSFLNKTARVGLVDALLDAGPPITSQARLRNFTYTARQASCRFYEQGLWSGDGCHATNKSTDTEIVCLCSHLTTFGGRVDFLVLNTLSLVDIESLFDLEENPVTVSLISLLILLYLVLFVICLKKDQHDLKKERVIPLEDNSPADKQTYVIILETGLRKGAGTTAKVSLVLHGEEGMSETRELVSQQKRSPFERNSRDVFIMTLPESIGPIWKIQLWHNNAGMSPSWYLSRVTVHDSTAGRTYYFNCEKWLAVEVDDGKVEREFMALDSGFRFDQIVWIKGSQYFADLHLWTSLFTRPSYSRFLRVERLTCCLTLVCSYMAVSAMWYKTYEREYRGSYGYVDISWRSVLVGLLTALVVLPANLIIVLLFRKSRLLGLPGQSSQSDYDVIDNDHAPYAASSAHSQAEARLMRNWQSLQQWAQLQWMRKYQNASISSQQNVEPVIIERVAEVENTETVHTEKRNDEKTENEENVEKTNKEKASAEMENQESGSTESVERNNRHNLENVNENAEIHDDTSPETYHLLSGDNLREFTNVEKETQRDQDFDHIPLSDLELARTIRETFVDSPQITQVSTPIPQALPNQNAPTALRTGSSVSDTKASERSSTMSQTSNSSTSVRESKLVKHASILAPSGLRVLAWLLCFSVTTLSCCVTIMYGFRFGYHKSVMWVQSLFFSWLTCVFISHPLMILALTVLAALRYQGSLSVLDHHHDNLDEDLRRFHQARRQQRYEMDDDSAESFEKGMAARQRSRYLRFARPPQEKQLIEARTQTIRQRKARDMLWNSLLYIVFVSVVLVISFADDKTTPFRLNQSVRSAFYGGVAKHPDWSKLGLQPADWPEMKLVGVAKPDDWWTWAMTSFTEHAYWETWYNGETTKKETGRMNYALEGSLLRLTPILLLQRRVLDVYCPVPYRQLHGPLESCKPAWSDREQGNTSLVTETLSDTRSEALSQLSRLKSEGWIDRDTSSITVHLTLYHAASRTHVPVKLTSHFTQTGKVRSEVQVEAIRLIRYTCPLDKLRLGCELLFIFLLLLKLQLLLSGSLLRQTCRYFHNQPWRYANLALIVTSSAYVIMYVLRFVFAYDVIDELRQTFYKEYVDLWFVVTWDRSMQTLLGVIQFLTLAELIKLLRYGSLFTRYLRVYRRARREIAVFLTLSVIVLCGYASLGTIWFQTTNEAFSSFAHAIMTSSSLMMFKGRLGNDVTGRALDEMTGGHVRVVVATVIVFSLALLLSYIGVVLIHAFRTSPCKDHQLTMTLTETLTFYWTQVRAAFTGRKEREARDGHEEQDKCLPAEFTMAEIEYQVEELLFKMNSILGGHNMPEKEHVFYTDSDCTYSTESGSDTRHSTESGSDTRRKLELPESEAGKERDLYATDSECKVEYTDSECTQQGSEVDDKPVEILEESFTQVDSGNDTLLDIAPPDGLRMRSSSERKLFSRSHVNRRSASPRLLMTSSDRLMTSSSDALTSSPERAMTTSPSNHDISATSGEAMSPDEITLLDEDSAPLAGPARRPRGPPEPLPPPDLLDIPIHALDESEAGVSTQYVDFCDDFFDDFSSGSEFSLPRSSRTDHSHSLKKTKSRGKGARKNFFTNKDVDFTTKTKKKKR